jgi:hypothetical protein
MCKYGMNEYRYGPNCYFLCHFLAVLYSTLACKRNKLTSKKNFSLNVKTDACVRRRVLHRSEGCDVSGVILRGFETDKRKLK